MRQGHGGSSTSGNGIASSPSSRLRCAVPPSPSPLPSAVNLGLLDGVSPASSAPRPRNAGSLTPSLPVSEVNAGAGAGAAYQLLPEGLASRCWAICNQGGKGSR